MLEDIFQAVQTQRVDEEGVRKKEKKGHWKDPDYAHKLCSNIFQSLEIIKGKKSRKWE